MKSKLIKFPEILMIQIQTYAESITPEGQTPNFSEAVRTLARLGLDSAYQCPKCGSDRPTIGTLCDSCR